MIQPSREAYTVAKALVHKSADIGLEAIQ